jgi:hypothetical protein
MKNKFLLSNLLLVAFLFFSTSGLSQNQYDGEIAAFHKRRIAVAAAAKECRSVCWQLYLQKVDHHGKRFSDPCDHQPGLWRLYVSGRHSFRK